LCHFGGGRNPGKQTVLQTDGNISPKITFFSRLAKILKVFTGKNLQPGIWLWFWIPAFAWPSPE
jgi:hypothetical protein